MLSEDEERGAHRQGGEVVPADRRPVAGRLVLPLSGPSVNTRRLVVEHGGFTYDSDYYGDELPFLADRRGQAAPRSSPIRSPTTTASTPTAMGHSDQWFGLVKDAFDVLYQGGCDAAEDDVGRPGTRASSAIPRPRRRPVAPPRLHAEAARVWITRRVDIANHWLKTHPYPGKVERVRCPQGRLAAYRASIEGAICGAASRLWQMHPFHWSSVAVDNQRLVDKNFSCLW